MNTTQLRYFLELSQTLNYSAAAQRLYVTQPTLSRSIMALEDEIGAKLFCRENGNVSLTPAGQLLLRELQPIAMRYESLLQRVRAVGNGMAGELHIALSTEQQMPDTLLQAIKSFSNAYPNVEFLLSRMDTHFLMAAFQEETVDLAVGLEFTSQRNVPGNMPMEYVLLEQEQPCLVRSAVGKSPTTMTITTEECKQILSKTKLIFPSSKYLGDETADPMVPLREMLHQPELLPDIRYARDANAVALYVAAGLGVTIANKSHGITRENGVDVLEILGAEPYRKVLEYRTDSRNPILARFLESLTKRIHY